MTYKEEEKLAMGATGYLPKPFKTAKLLEKFNGHLLKHVPMAESIVDGMPKFRTRLGFVSEMDQGQPGGKRKIGSIAPCKPTFRRKSKLNSPGPLLCSDASPTPYITSQEDHRTYQHPNMPLTALDPTTALIIIDLQKGIVAMPDRAPRRRGSPPRGSTRGSLPPPPPARRARERGRRARPAARSRRQSRRAPAGLGRSRPRAEPATQDHLVTKRTWGAFTNTGLEDTSKSWGHAGRHRRRSPPALASSPPRVRARTRI